MRRTIHEHISVLKNNRGAVIALVAIVLFVLLGVAAFAIDFGYRHVVRNELQNAADSAALAATRELGTIYQGLSYEDQQTYVCNPSDIVPIAQEAALENYAGNIDNLTVNSADVVIGDWDFTASAGDPLTATLNQPNAVRVTVRRDGSANGPISTFFARIFNVDTMGITARATAALSGQSTAEPGEIELPIGISRWWFDNNSCNDTIAFSPSNDPDSCAGWNTFDSTPSNDAKVRDILNGGLQSPHTVAGEVEYSFIGGDLSTPTFNALMSAFQSHGYDVSAPETPILDPVSGEPMTDATGSGQEVPLCDSINGGLTTCSSADSNGTAATYPDGTPRNMHEWPTTVPVYDRNDCSNPNQSIKIVGFAYVLVNDVVGPPDKNVRAKVLCNYIEAEDARGGGGNYGTLGSVPGLVE